jgi:hypothetical protein
MLIQRLTRGRRVRRAMVVLSIAGCSAGALGTLAAAATATPTADQAVAELNVWRTELGESPVSTATVAAWNTGCQHHNNYENRNGNTVTRTEVGGNPGYTTDGAQAGSDSVLALGANTGDAGLLPGPAWDSGVFRRADLLQPRLGQVGFSSDAFGTVAFDCMWVLDQGVTPPQPIDNSRTTPGLTLYPSPGNGAYNVPTTFPAGSESPDPATETGVPGGSALGWLLNVEINGPWADGGFGYQVAAHGVTATLAPDGTTAFVPLVVSQCGPSGCGGAGGTSEGGYFEGGFGIFPTQPLAANTTYRVVLTGGTVSNFQAHIDYPIPSGYSWCFSTGAVYTPSADCAPPTAAAEEPVNPNASTALSGAGTGSGGGSGGGGGAGTGGGGSTPTTGHPTTIATKTTAGRQRIGATLTLPQACVAASQRMSLRVSASTIAGSHAARLRFAGGEVFIDRGVRHVRHHVVRRHGRRVHLTTITYSPNRTFTRIPVTLSLPAAKLAGGNHLLSVHLRLTRTVRRHGRRTSLVTTRVLRSRFPVCRTRSQLGPSS